jgi:hypothetical protein
MRSGRSDNSVIEAGAALASVPADRPEPTAPKAVARLIALDEGFYAFSILGEGSGTGVAPGFSIPAVHVSAPPDRFDTLEITGLDGHPAGWLGARQGILFVKAAPGGGHALVTAYPARDPELPPLRLEIRRLDAVGLADRPATDAAAIPRPPFANLLLADPAATPLGREDLPIEIVAHVRRRGDIRFVDASWAGRLGPGLWIESFTILPRHRLAAAAIEYKGLTAAGAETDWLSSGTSCGTRGANTPLVGFAVRQRPIAGNALFDCEYSGYFQSGAVVGPCRNGAPCLSAVANDSLEGMQLRIVERPKHADPLPDARTRD